MSTSTDDVHIDGAMGEGGGQVVRTSLALSAVTGRPVHIDRIRAGRKKKGLLRQHLTAARAAATISGGALEGAELGSTELRLWPGAVQPGRYHFAIGSAGSATLVLQAALPPLLLADGPSTVVLEGGTHNPQAPPFDFLQRCLAPQLERLGAGVSLRIESYGFYPRGGGRLIVEVEPQKLEPFELHERGKLVDRQVTALLSQLPDHIGERMVSRFQKRSGWPKRQFAVRDVPSPGPGTVLLAEVRHAQVVELVTGFGRRGLPSESIADSVYQEMRSHLKHGAPVGEYLADQLMVPFALAGGGGFTTRALSRHATTQVDLIPKFLDVTIQVAAEDGLQRVSFART
ncbi:MAG: RNA 3'-terminal phosphate cyclase [Acidobacteriota bacterium]